MLNESFPFIIRLPLSAALALATSFAHARLDLGPAQSVACILVRTHYLGRKAVLFHRPRWYNAEDKRPCEYEHVYEECHYAVNA
jgi:hypothetical protein